MMRRILGAVAAALVVLVLAGAAYVRLAPHDVAAEDVLPAEGAPGAGAYLVAEGGDRPPLRLDAGPAEVLAALDAIALGMPRTERLVWAPEEGRATYVTRSAVMGFPDYTSVRVVPDGNGARLTAYARLRFGQDDMGVNEARLTDWLARLEAAL